MQGLFQQSAAAGNTPEQFAEWYLDQHDAQLQPAHEGAAAGPAAMLPVPAGGPTRVTSRRPSAEAAGAGERRKRASRWEPAPAAEPSTVLVVDVHGLIQPNGHAIMKNVAAAPAAAAGSGGDVSALVVPWMDVQHLNDLKSFAKGECVTRRLHGPSEPGAHCTLLRAIAVEPQHSKVCLGCTRAHSPARLRP
jgi:hypothetical protein